MQQEGNDEILMALTSIARACTETFDERKASLLSSRCYLSFQSLRMVLTTWQMQRREWLGWQVALVESMSTEGKATNLKGYFDSEYGAND